MFKNTTTVLLLLISNLETEEYARLALHHITALYLIGSGNSSLCILGRSASSNDDGMSTLGPR